MLDHGTNIWLNKSKLFKEKTESADVKNLSDKKLKLLFGGDVMLARGVNEVIQREGPSYPLAPLASMMRSADRVLVNLECAISPEDTIYSGPHKMFYFRADPLAAETLAHAGVDLVSLANNHALDANYMGLLTTIAILDEHEIAHAGAGENLDEAGKPALLDDKGQRLGVLSGCDHQQDFAAQEKTPGILYFDATRPEDRKSLATRVEDLAQEVDHVVVALHWQSNWVPRVPQQYRSLARLLVEAGARVLWGHSPHHFQGVEWLDKSVVLYSTGGLLDDYAVDPGFRNDRQLLFQVTLSKEGVDKVEAYPIELDFGRTQTASSEARYWIDQRFTKMCEEVGSKVAREDGWLEVLSA